MDKIMKAIKNFFNKRSLKYGSNSIILIAAVVGIAILVNVLVGMADLKLDLTANKLYSLTDVTKNVLKDLKQDVTIVGLFDDGKVSVDYKEVTDLLGLYEKNSSHIKVEYIDPDKNPGIIKELDDQNTLDLAKNELVVKSTVNGKEKKKKLDYYDLFNVEYDQSFNSAITGSNAEQGFTGAIKYVTAEITPVVYFTEGHNEIEVDSDYTMVKSFLEYNNYEVKTINLITAGKFPEDAEIVVIASPKNDLTTQEKNAVEDYLKTGGKAVFMFDYLAGDPDFNNFNSLLSTFNVAVNYDKVKDADTGRHLPDDEYSIVLDVSSNSIVSQVSNVLFANSRSVSILKNEKEYITPTSLITTSSTAIGEAASASRGENTQGPLDIAVAVENKGGAAVSKILVMGNASFISDTTAQKNPNYFYNSQIFFVQSLNWMFNKQEEVVVPTKNYEAIQINISQLQATMMGVVVVIIIPLIILGTGLFVFLRRRHL